MLVGRMGRAIAGFRANIGKEHKYSKNLTDALSPLPIPPPSASPSSRVRPRYSDSPTKSEFTSPPPENEGDDRENLKRTIEGLPLNTRDWSKGELGTYLKAAMRAQSANGQGWCPKHNSIYTCSLYINIESTGVHLPPRLVLDITQWVCEQGMNGRSFVRLGENELER